MKLLASMCFPILALSTLIVTGCASTPTLGDKMAEHGKVTESLGTDWNRGDSMVKKGLKLQKESESLAEKSNSKRAESERLLNEGKQLMQDTEIAYQNQFGTSMR